MLETKIYIFGVVRENIRDVTDIRIVSELLEVLEKIVVFSQISYRYFCLPAFLDKV